MYDYEIRFEDGSTTKVKESEIDRIGEGNVERKPLFNLNDRVVAKNGYEGFVGTIQDRDEFDKMPFGYGVKFDGIETVNWFWEDQIELYDENKHKQVDSVGKFERIATELGKFTDLKNKQYGSSVDATYEIMKVLMERYTYDEERYLIPKDLLKHILLQVRMMDKTNRIFNNPSGKGDSESPYRDLCGYSLIGVEMVERSKEDENK